MSSAKTVPTPLRGLQSDLAGLAHQAAQLSGGAPHLGGRWRRWRAGAAGGGMGLVGPGSDGAALARRARVGPGANRGF